MVFKNFLLKFSDKIFSEKPSSDVLSKYELLLPAELIQFWKIHGFSGYKRGLFWIVNPVHYEDCIYEWIDVSEKPVVIARTAFADLFVWMDNAVFFMDVQYGELTELGNDVARFFNVFLCNSELLAESCREGLFSEAHKKLGDLQPLECFAFVPALVLGGKEDVNFIEKVQVREYLSILANLLGNS